MTARSREDELREVPLWKANKERWPPGVRETAMEEQDCLGIDRRGNLYWDGKPIEVRYFGLTLTRWQQVVYGTCTRARRFDILCRSQNISARSICVFRRLSTLQRSNNDVV